MRIVTLARDLNVTSKLHMMAREDHGVEVHATLSAVMQSLEELPADLVLIDLTCQAVDPALAGRIRVTNARPCRLAAFGPHVQEQKLASAAAAGCEYVWSRGRWEQELRKLLDGQA